MAYKALYRKYRPALFEDVYGQEEIVKTLQNAIELNKIGHAYLFTGTRGTGKTTIAKIFAKSVNCLNFKNGKNCGKCETCIENIDEMQDIIEMDAASNNGVDEIRELNTKVKLVPSLCKYKVYIIDEVHMLSTGAFNALLKTLEEPPAHVIFILATTEPAKIPMTVISRCQRFDFKRISIKNIVERLKFIAHEEKIEIEDAALYEISKLSDGAFRDAIGFLEQVSSYTDKKININDIYSLSGNISKERLYELADNIFDNKVEESLSIIGNLYYEGKDFSKIAEDMMILFRNILIYKNANKYFERNNIPDKEYIIKLNDKIHEKTLINMTEEINRLVTDMKDSSYPRILFELFIYKISTCNEDVINKQNNEVVQKMKMKKDDLNNEQKKEKLLNKEIHTENKTTDETKKEFSNMDKKIKEYKRILINNTIALADKKALKKMMDKFNELDKYLIDKKYKDIASLLLDSKINAVSDDHLLVTFKYLSLVENFDKNIKKVNSLLKELTEREFKVVGITEDEWKEIRPYYLDMKKSNKNIELLEEIELNEMAPPNKKEHPAVIMDAIDVFGEELIEIER